MPEFDRWLGDQLAGIRRLGLHRVLRTVGGRGEGRLAVGNEELVDFGSNDYLGLATHPRVVEAARQALAEWGAGSGASRLMSGSLAVHQTLESRLAAFKGVEAALTFSSGHAAALGTIPALVGRGDTVILDRLAHACLVDGARLSGARLRVFRHNDLADLERVLEGLSRTGSAGRVLVATESLFSMDGDLAPLAGVVALKERFGAWLLVDEAHATGLYGPGHAGWARAAGVQGGIEIQMATLGKALGSAGGAICGSRRLIEFLVNRARSLIFSTAPSPAGVAAAAAALELLGLPEGTERVAQLWRNVDDLRERMARAGMPVAADRSPILPILMGCEERAVAASTRLREAGFLVPAARYPAVARGRARLRVTVSAQHRPADLAGLVEVLAEAGKEVA